MALSEFLTNEWNPKILRPFYGNVPVGLTSGNWGTSPTGLFINEVLSGVGIDDFRPGQLIQVDYELMRVQAVPNDPQNGQLELMRGYLGTPITSPQNQTRIYINPPVYSADVVELINEALQKMYPTVFQVGSLTLNYLGAKIGYDLTGMAAGAKEPLAVYGEVNSQASLWEPINDWHYETNLPTAEFASGKALMMRASLPTGARIQVVYPQPFTLFDHTALNGSEQVSDTGISDYMESCLSLYVKSQLYANREGLRNKIDSAVGHQRAQDVPAFASLRTADWYMSRFEDALDNAHHIQQQEVRRRRGSGYGS